MRGKGNVNHSDTKQQTPVNKHTCTTLFQNRVQGMKVKTLNGKQLVAGQNTRRFHFCINPSLLSFQDSEEKHVFVKCSCFNTVSVHPHMNVTGY
jgi:hypothetical protein